MRKYKMQFCYGIAGCVSSNRQANCPQNVAEFFFAPLVTSSDLLLLGRFVVANQSAVEAGARTVGQDTRFRYRHTKIERVSELRK